MKVLIDTNILSDYLAVREPYFKDAQNIILACCQGRIDGCIAAHSVCNMFYILRSQMPEATRRKALLWFCEILTVIGVGKHKLAAALENQDFRDMEDCLQTECAAEYSADYIVTRNTKDFEQSRVPAIEPGKLLEMIG